MELPHTFEAGDQRSKHAKTQGRLKIKSLKGFGETAASPAISMDWQTSRKVEPVSIVMILHFCELDGHSVFIGSWLWSASFWNTVGQVHV
jgi:hypothetical protein